MPDETNGIEITLSDSKTANVTYTVVALEGEDFQGYFEVQYYISTSYESVSCYLEAYENESTARGDSCDDSYSTIDGVKVYTFTHEVEEGDTTAYTYKLDFNFYQDGSSVTDNTGDVITKIVEGLYDTLEDTSNETDITAGMYTGNNYYTIDFSTGAKDYTVFTARGNVIKLTLKLQLDVVTVEDAVGVLEPNYGSADTYFYVSDAVELTEKVAIVSYKNDSYYDLGYQTVFYTEDDALGSLTPEFWSSTTATIYAGHDGSVGTEQISGTTVQDFSNGPVQYSAAAENGTALKNYWVTFVKHSSDSAALYVHGINGDDGATREIFLNSAYDNLHDIFIANVGNASLTSLTATLVDAQNVQLDEYWTVGEAGNNELQSITAYDSTTGDEQKNFAKIRLLPTLDEDGEIVNGDVSGTLVISAEGIDPVEIELTGTAGDPYLTTEEIPDAVKYVPYAVQLAHNNKFDWNTVTLSIDEGTLPAGMELKANGEIYGVPTETGYFTFTVLMENSYSGFSDSTMEYTLYVNYNSDSNVENSTNVDYEITDWVGTYQTVEYDDDGEYWTEEQYVVNTNSADTFVSNGEYVEFIDFWLNGVKLTEGTDYDSEAGSTRITIASQTFSNLAVEGTNTIAAEFRTENGSVDEGELKTAAQNFEITDSSSTSTDTISTRTDSSSSSSAASVVVETINGTYDIYMPATAVENAYDLYIELMEESIEEAENDDTSLFRIHATDFSNDSLTMAVMLYLDCFQALSELENATVAFDLEQIGEVSFDHKTITFLAKLDASYAELCVTKTGTEVYVYLAVDDEELYDLQGEMKVYLLDMAEGETIVLQSQNGNTEVVKKSAVVGKDVYALLGGSGNVIVVNRSKVFVDVPEGMWYSDAIDFMSSRELFIGVSDTEFAPTMSATKAMLIAAIYRLEEPGMVSNFGSFSDVNWGDWYFTEMMWGAEEGIVVGDGTGVAGANTAVTLETMATYLYRYAEFVGMDTTVSANLNAFADASLISVWAKDQVSWAVANGLIEGDGTKLNPTTIATRAQIATVFTRFVHLMVQ